MRFQYQSYYSDPVKGHGSCLRVLPLHQTSSPVVQLRGIFNCRYPRYSESGGRLVLFHEFVHAQWMHPVVPSKGGLCV